MDWNRVEGNWKQFRGSVKEKWATSPMTISMSSTADASNWKGRFRNATALLRTRRAATWTIGLSLCRRRVAAQPRALSEGRREKAAGAIKPCILVRESASVGALFVYREQERRVPRWRSEARQGETNGPTFRNAFRRHAVD